MSDVEFEEVSYTTPTMTRKTNDEKKSKMIEMIIKSGLAKDEKSARYILLSVAIVCILAIIIILILMLRQPRLTYNIRPDILNTLPADIQINVQNANR